MAETKNLTTDSQEPKIDVDLDVLNRDQFAADTIYERKVQPYLDDIVKMKAQNFTDKEMCRILDISTTTFYQLRKLHTDLQIAYKTGIDMLVDEVESAAFKEAIGYDYKEQQLDKFGNAVDVKKYARGSAAMQKYILNNKRSSEYASKQTVMTDKTNVIDLTALKGTTPLELKKLIDEIEKRKQSD